MIMYVELDKRVFKAFESVLKEVSGRGLVLFIIFHLMMFSMARFLVQWQFPNFCSAFS